METLITIYEQIESFGLHRHGWLLAAVILIIPAIVSGNMAQHYFTLLLRRQYSWRQLLKPIVGNLIIAFLCGSIIIIAVLQYMD